MSPTFRTPMSNDGSKIVIASQGELCVTTFGRGEFSCTDAPDRIPTWSPSGEFLMVETWEATDPAVIYPVSESAVLGEPRTVPAEVQFLDWMGDDRIVARVEGYLAMYDLETGTSERIGEVQTPYSARQVEEWLWVAADRGVVAHNDSGFEQEFDLGDRFRLLSTSASGDRVLVRREGGDHEAFVLDAIDGTMTTLDSETGGRSTIGQTLSPDGNIVLAVVLKEDNSRDLVFAETAGVIGEAEWTVLTTDTDLLLDYVTWIRPTQIRTRAQFSMVELFLIDGST